jgi:hypothetical protein
VSAPRTFVALAVIVLALAASALLVVASGGGTASGHSGTAQYGVKPGCLTSETDAVKGRHEGQRPQRNQRGNCP